MSKSVLSVCLLSQHGGDCLHPVHHRDHEGLQIQLRVVPKVPDHLIPGAGHVTGISLLGQSFKQTPSSHCFQVINLHQFARDGDLVRLSESLDSESLREKVNELDAKENTPLHYACR